MNDSIEFDHEQVKRYLLATGWERQQEASEGISEKYSKDKKVVNLITEPSLPSYKSYLKDTVHALSLLEQEKLDSLIEKIEFTGSHRFSVIVDDGKAGHRIRLQESSKLRNAVSDMLLAISHSALTPSINHLRLSRKDAVSMHSEFLEDQTGKSSYIANFLIPQVRIENLSGEMVAETVKSALITAAQVAEKDTLPSSSEYVELAKKGISANFLNALCDLKGIGTSDSVKFKMDNSPPITMTSEHLSNLNDFHSEITSPSNRTITLDGKVIATSAFPECTVTIECDIDAARKNVKLKISIDQYKLVINEEQRVISNASDLTDRPVIRVTGILRKRSRGRHEIVEMSSFEVATGTNK